jgi:hypothetical protein
MDRAAQELELEGLFQAAGEQLTEEEKREAEKKWQLLQLAHRREQLEAQRSKGYVPPVGGIDEQSCRVDDEPDEEESGEGFVDREARSARHRLLGRKPDEEEENEEERKEDDEEVND